MKKILSAFIIFISLFSCSKNEIYEEILSKHQDGNRKEVRYYSINKDGSKTCIRETWYYMEGMKHLDGPIVNGKRNGIFKTYYKSGTVMSSGEFVDGIREGKASVYHENGKIKYEGSYSNGKECGIWKFYDEEGNLIKETNRDLK